MESTVLRVLFCRDILVEVFEHMSPGWLWECPYVMVAEEVTRRQGNRRALASCARVCHAFLEPALDVLWRVLDDVDAALRLLPSWKFHTRGASHGARYILSEVITPVQWSRLQWYARRVRGLQGARSTEKFHHSVWPILDHARNGQPLFPRLKRMEVTVPVHNPACLTRLLSTSLKNLKISFRRDEKLVAPELAGTLLQLVAPEVPNLVNLWIEGGLEELPPKYLQFLSNLTSIRELNMFDSGAALDYPALQLLSRIATLRVLDVDVSFRGLEAGSEVAFDPGAFRSLSEMNIRGQHTHLITFLAATRLPKLKQLGIILLGTPTEQSIHDALSSICAHMSPSLTALSLALGEKRIRRATTMTCAQVFEPLFSLKSLRSVEVHCDQFPALTFTDDDATVFASVWPKLSDITLSFTDSPTPRNHDPTAANASRGSLSVHALIEFAQRCPTLERLTFDQLDITTLPALDTVPEVGHSAMRCLQVWPLVGAATADLAKFAAIIDVLFPKLTLDRRANVLADYNCLPHPPANIGRIIRQPPPNTYPRQVDINLHPWRIVQAILSAIRMRRSLSDAVCDEEDTAAVDTDLQDLGSDTEALSVSDADS